MPDDDERLSYNPEFIEHAARATLHEFLLEIIFANDFVLHAAPRADFERMRREMLDLIRYKMTVRDVPGPLRDDPGDLSLVIQEETVKTAERFFEKVSDRLDHFLELKARTKNK